VARTQGAVTLTAAHAGALSENKTMKVERSFFMIGRVGAAKVMV
jgi:hypothetical protein